LIKAICINSKVNQIIIQQSAYFREATMQQSDFRFSHTLRVRWAEVDMQKIVFNGHYLMYFDTAVAQYWRDLAMPYEQAMHQLGGDLFVAKAVVEYKASARYEDRLRVCLKLSRIGNSSMTFTGAIFCDGKLLVTGELVYAYANPATQKSQTVPDVLRSWLLDFEAGKPMTHLAVGDWQTLGTSAMALRTEVFVAEQGVPLELEHDEQDAKCEHAVVFNRLNQPMATGRLLPAEGGISRIGRMAVKRVLRGSGLGQAVLQALLDKASNRGDLEVVLHAQTSAQDFYAQFGFQAEGDIFEEAGIEHVTMRLKCDPFVTS
jgi:YbgC/YbaW family acyl-CoA thioester hydrolase